MLKKAASKSTDSPVILYHLGAAYKKTGNSRAARMNLEKALKLSENFNGAAAARRLLEAL